MRSASLFIRCLLRWGFVLLPGLLVACTDPYLPDVVKSPPSYLVVDGYINPRGTSTIRLSRTYAVSASSAPPPEAKALAYFEDDAGSRFPLTEAPVGTYTSAALTLSTARKYRLHLTTQGGKDYASDYVAVKLTPPIDALNWRAESTGLNFYVSAHDPANATRYYRWDYTETWEISPIYQPSLEYVNRTMRSITTPYPIICWGNSVSTGVGLAKTTALTQDVVSNYPLHLLPSTSERLFHRYSLLVQQYGLTQEEYAYWELMRKNTESIGTLFDPQPVQLTGNVHSLSNAGEIVLGYVGAHTVVQQRIFVARAELPANWRIPSGYENCYPPDTVVLFPRTPPPLTAAERDALLFAAFHDPNAYVPIDITRLGYTGKSRDCVDCRTRGTAVKPSFWP